MRLALSLLMAAGCTFHASYDGTHYQCGAGGACPTGQTCVANECVAGPSDLDAPAGTNDAVVDAATGSPDATLGVAGCGAVGLLTDTFDGAVFPRWYAWSDGGPSASITGGQLVVHIPTGNGAQGAGLASRFWYDFTNSQVEATVSQVGGHDTIVEVRGREGGKLQMVVEDGVLSAGVFDLPGGGTRAHLTYDPTSQKRWRIRENDGTAFWEWSVDGITWNELWHEADPFPPGYVQVQLSASGSLAQPSDAHFDETNVGGPSVPGFCACASLVDDFTGMLDPVWDAWNDSPSTTQETGGKVVLSLPAVSPLPADGVWGGVQTNHLFDLTQSTVYVDVPPPPQAATLVTFLQVDQYGDPDNMIEFNEENGTLSMDQVVGGTTMNQTDVGYDGTAQRYWRLRGAGGKIYWDVSPDGASWTNLKSLTPAIDLSSVLIAVGGGEYDPGTDAAEAISFGGVNAP